MANSVTTKIAREKMAKARSGDIVLPKIAMMAFGNGGTDGSGVPISPSDMDTSLKNELLRKEIDGHSFPILTTCRYSATISKPELVAMKISEIALIDEEGDLIAIKSFTEKTKDADMEMIFQIDDEF